MLARTVLLVARGAVTGGEVCLAALPAGAHKDVVRGVRWLGPSARVVSFSSEKVGRPWPLAALWPLFASAICPVADDMQAEHAGCPVLTAACRACQIRVQGDTLLTHPVPALLRCHMATGTRC